MLNHPVLPAILLAVSAYRLLMGSATWLTAVSALAAAAWLASAWKDWQAKREAADLPPPREPPPSAPPAITAEQVASLRAMIDDNRKAREPPRLPSEDDIRATAKPAIAVLREALPQPLDGPGRSYLGGLPRLPPGVEWPEMERFERFAPTFLAQIDLSELPAEGNPLPRAGTLYFFADANDDAPEPEDCRVLFHPGDASGFPLRDPPPTARPIVDGGAPWPWLPESSVWSKAGFRFPVRFAAFDSVRDYVVEAGARSPPRRNSRAFETIMAAEFTRRFGHREAPSTDAWAVFERTDDDWPFAWVAVEFAARAIARAADDALGRRESLPARERLTGVAAAANSWVERAARETPHARTPEDARLAFASEWRAWDAAFEAIGRETKVNVRSHRESSDVLAGACYVCASNGASDVIPQRYARALAHLADPVIGFPGHQMLGHAQKVQWAPIHRAAQTLLLHLWGDPSLGWHAHSGCALQFWIEPEALARADFGSVQMTLECD
jgi:hypothetical protein